MHFVFYNRQRRTILARNVRNIYIYIFLLFVRRHANDWCRFNNCHKYYTYLNNLCRSYIWNLISLSTNYIIYSTTIIIILRTSYSSIRCIKCLIETQKWIIQLPTIIVNISTYNSSCCVRAARRVCLNYFYCLLFVCGQLLFCRFPTTTGFAVSGNDRFNCCNYYRIKHNHFHRHVIREWSAPGSCGENRHGRLPQYWDSWYRYGGIKTNNFGKSIFKFVFYKLVFAPINGSLHIFYYGF